MDQGTDNSANGQQQAGWQYKPSGQAAAPAETAPPPPQAAAPSSLPQTAPAPSGDAVEWTASEFVAHDKDAGWYGMLGLGALVIGAVIYFITRDIISTAVIAILAIIFGVAGARKPRVLTYRLDTRGITAGAKFHPYSDYKSFAMPEEEPFASIVFVPMKRFGFPLSIYLAPEQQQRVLDVLSSHLPLERGQLDGVERLMRRVRF